MCLSLAVEHSFNGCRWMHRKLVAAICYLWHARQICTDAYRCNQAHGSETAPGKRAGGFRGNLSTCSTDERYLFCSGTAIPGFGHFVCNDIAHNWSPWLFSDRTNVDKHLIAAAIPFDKSEATVFVPGSNFSLISHSNSSRVSRYQLDS